MFRAVIFSMKVYVVSGLSNPKLYSKIFPFLALESVEQVVLIRREPLNVPGVVNCCPPKWMRKILPFSDLYRLLILFRLLVFRKKPSIIIAFYMVPHGLYAWLAGKLFGVKVIQVIVGTDLEKISKSKFLRKALNSAYRVGVRGANTAKLIESWGIDKNTLFIPHNVLDVKLFSRCGSTEKRFDFIYVGNLVEPKDLPLLIKAVAVVKKAFPKVTLAVVGDGPLKTSLQSLVREMKLELNVTLMPAKKNEGIPSILNAAKYFIMTSRTEGLPMAMIEALSCGLPVIMPDVGEISSIAVHNENAIVISERTKEMYAFEMARLLKDKDLYNKLADGALKSREKFISEFSPEAIQSTWAKVLGEIR